MCCGAGVQASLTGLYQAIEARLALYKPLLSLQGRLDLVLAQAAPADPLASQLAQGPLVSPPAWPLCVHMPCKPSRCPLSACLLVSAMCVLAS